MDNETTFAEFLTKLMDERNLSQRQLADKARISQQAVSVYVNGDKKPTRNTIHKIAPALGFSPAELMKYASEPRKNSPMKGKTMLALTSDEEYVVTVFRDLPKIHQFKAIKMLTDIRAEVTPEEYAQSKREQEEQELHQ
jgi:transcriptional regulator with XRE-family HTH domain